MAAMPSCVVCRSKPDEFASAAEQQTSAYCLFDDEPNSEAVLALLHIQQFGMMLGREITGAEQQMADGLRRQRLGNQDLPAPGDDRRFIAVFAW